MTEDYQGLTPPPELVHQWANHSASVHRENGTYEQHEFAIATQAARWGADQELEACLVEIRDGAGRIYIDETRLRVLLAEDIWTARRPKPPTLKEQALGALDVIEDQYAGPSTQEILIRRALEQLDD
jgi:hypothetical protein